MESNEENNTRPNDLLERSAILEMGDDGVSITPEGDVNTEENTNAQGKTKESVKTMSQLRKLSSTNAAGVKESVNLPKRRSQKPTLAVARPKYDSALNELSSEIDDYLSLHKPREFIQEEERPEASRRFKRIKRQLGATLNLAEDLFYLLASNADTLGQNELRKQVDIVEERVIAIHLGHSEFHDEMSTIDFAGEWRGRGVNAMNNKLPSVSGSTRSKEDLERSVLDRAVDNAEQRQLDELEIKEREIRRNADLAREKIALQHCSQGNGQGYTPDEVTDQQTAIIEDCTHNIAARI